MGKFILLDYKLLHLSHPPLINDPVNHPSHYCEGGIETIDFIEAKKLNFCKGNAVKYISRAGKKSKATEIQDLEKAIWYIQHEINMLKKV